jgi:hypothetical protein
MRSLIVDVENCLQVLIPPHFELSSHKFSVKLYGSLLSNPSGFSRYTLPFIYFSLDE